MKQHTAGETMIVEGLPASPGIARGPLWRYRRDRLRFSEEEIDDTDISRHLDRWRKAADQVDDELTRMRDGEEDPETRAILEAQIQIVRDPDLEKRITAEIRDRKPADRATYSVFESYLQAMNVRGEEERGDRSVDLTDIRDRLIALVQDHDPDLSVEEGSVILARELSAREVIRLSGRHIRAIVTERGGTSSHAAIIARSMGIPTVMGAGKALSNGVDGTDAIVDGSSGTVVLRPDREALKTFEEKQEEMDRLREARARICRKPGTTSDGFSFALRANVEFPEELEKINLFCAEGIGLLRTESVYLERSHFDDLQKQEKFYEHMLEETGDHPVTIRLFDAGGDKFFGPGELERNPFLGWRGIRMLIDERKLLRDQLEAILRVGGRFPGRMRILIPMVSDPAEVRLVQEEITALCDRLEEEGIAVDRGVPIGIMIEVPAVALQSEHYAGLVDFFSIGTNDLTQYLLAVDRGNERVSRLYDQRHPAVWQLIRHCAEVASAQGIGITVCGELASDPVSAACLLGMGISDLSMSPSRIPEVKELLMKRTRTEMAELAEVVIDTETAGDIGRLFEEWKNG